MTRLYKFQPLASFVCPWRFGRLALLAACYAATNIIEELAQIACPAAHCAEVQAFVSGFAAAKQQEQPHVFVK